MADLNNSAVSGLYADPDGVGLANFGRYAFDLPARGQISPPTASQMITVSGQNYLALTFTRKVQANDVRYLVQASSDLLNWTVLSTFAAGNPSQVTVQDTVSVENTDRRFMGVSLQYNGSPYVVFYKNDFNDPAAPLSEWSGGNYLWSGKGGSGSATQPITTVASANNRQRFLGEFGGGQIVSGPPFVRVDQTVTLTLNNLPPHTSVNLTFDLYVLKSWDGNNPTFGRDRWSLAVGGGATLLDTSFSNNPKTGSDFSPQDYPTPGSPFQKGASAVNTLGYHFFGDAIYPLSFTFAHSGDTLILNFSSSLFEGKGADDESWGLDNVVVKINSTQ